MTPKDSPKSSDIDQIIGGLTKTFSGLVLSPIDAFAESIKGISGIDTKKVDEIRDEIIRNYTGKLETNIFPTVSSTKVKKEIEEGKGCIHKLLRGNRKDQQCGRLVSQHSEYCSTHERARRKKGDVDDSVVRDGKYTFIELDKNSGLYRVDKTQLVVGLMYIEKKISKSNLIVHGYVEGNVVKPLDEEHKKVAIANGLMAEEE